MGHFLPLGFKASTAYHLACRSKIRLESNQRSPTLPYLAPSGVKPRTKPPYVRAYLVEEAVGFEPTDPFQGLRFSRPVP